MSTATLIYDELDSTMAEAARAASGLSAPTWILARHQTAARGRRGRAWTHPEGNFAATLVMPAPPAAEAALRSFVAALALRDTLTALGVDRLSLKWPNDVLVGGAKVAGILLEVLPGEKLAIGIGINLKSAPDVRDVEPDAVPPAALGLIDPPEAVLSLLSGAFERWNSMLEAEGFAPIREAWLNDAARLGEAIRARTGAAEHHGTFEGIDMQGQLVLSTHRGRTLIPAADVYF